MAKLTKCERNRHEAFIRARQRAMNAGLDVDTADACAHRVMDIWDPEYTEREWLAFIDEEITRHAQP
jgi:hypothetical protein